VRLKVEAAGRVDDVDARAKAMTRRPAGWQAARRRQSPGGRGGRRGRGGRVGGTRRPGQVGEEADRVPGADGGGPATWWGRGHRRVGGRRIPGGRRRRRIPRGRGRGARWKAAVGEDDGGGGGGGHDDNDGGGSGTKKWPSAGGGGSLLLYIDIPLVPGYVTNRDKRPPFCLGS
jgi:hypothetical protein